jgi:hypothetical protein
MAPDEKPKDEPKPSKSKTQTVRVPAEMVKIVDPDNNDPSPPASPNALVQLAVERDLDIERLGKLLDLQLRWEQENARKAFFAALSKFQAELPPIVQTDRVNAGKAGKRKYAKLGTINEAIRPFLYGNGLSFRFRQQQTEAITVTCIVSHRDGHSEETSLSAAADMTGGKNAVQSIGSTITYLQRYTLIAALGLTTVSYDDDGESSEDDHDPATAQRRSPEELAELARKAAGGPPQKQEEALLVSKQRVEEIVGVMRKLFATGEEAGEWLKQHTHGKSHPGLLTPNEADGVLSELLRMEVERSQAEKTPPSTEPEPVTPGGPSAPASKEQRDEIRALTEKLYGQAAGEQQRLWLQALGYGSAMAITNIQAIDRTAQLKAMLDPRPEEEPRKDPF